MAARKVKYHGKTFRSKTAFRKYQAYKHIHIKKGKRKG